MLCHSLDVARGPHSNGTAQVPVLADSRRARTAHTFMVIKVDVLIQIYCTNQLVFPWIILESYYRHKIISFLEDMIHYVNKMCFVRKYMCDVLLL